MTVSDAETLRPVETMAIVSSDAQPEWVTGELPPQYADIANQIAALKEQALKYEGVAGVLWRTGPDLTAAVQELFTALQFQTELMSHGSNFDIRVDLGEGRHLLVDVVGGTYAIDRKSPQIAQILRALQEDAGETDRVVLTANLFASMPVAARPQEHVTLDAMRLIQGLGANFVPTSALFGIWKMSLEDLAHARKSVMNLYTMDGGIFR